MRTMVLITMRHWHDDSMPLDSAVAAGAGDYLYAIGAHGVPMPAGPSEKARVWFFQPTAINTAH